jgi:hypothetical protein
MRKPTLPPHVVIEKMTALAREEGYGVDTLTLSYYNSNYKLATEVGMIDHTQLGTERVDLTILEDTLRRLGI